VGITAKSTEGWVTEVKKSARTIIVYGTSSIKNIPCGLLLHRLYEIRISVSVSSHRTAMYYVSSARR